MEIQAGVVPFLRKRKGIRIILITTFEGDRWIVPKGRLEDGLTCPESAAQEALEEAGLVGRVGVQSIGNYESVKGAMPIRIRLFPLEVETMLKKWPEDCFRERSVFGIDEAADLVVEPSLRRILRKFPKLLEESSL